MAAAAGKGGKGDKHMCPPIPAGWERKITGPEAEGPSFAQQGEDIANGRFVEEMGEDGRIWKVHPCVLKNRTNWFNYLRLVTNKEVVKPMPSQRHGMRHAAAQ